MLEELIAIKKLILLKILKQKMTKRQQLFICLIFKTSFHLSNNSTNKFNQLIHYYSITQLSKRKRLRHCQ